MSTPIDSRFDEDCQLERRGDGVYMGAISDRWGIYGRPNGGFLAAYLAAALRQALPHADPFTATTHYLRPASPGPAEVHVETLRAGRGSSTGVARLLQEGTVRAQMTATLGDLDARRGVTVEEARMPELPPPDACDARDAGPPAGQATFGRQVDLRYVPGTIPFVEGRLEGPMELGGWMRFADGRAPDARALLLFADAMPPPTLRVVERVWVPTLELTVHVRRRPAPGWIGAWFRTRWLIDGYLEEDGELWDSDGKLVAISRQLARVQTS